MSKLTYDKNGFYIDGRPFRILSGAIHYFRIPKQYYYDRLSKLKECGFNTVETYVAWNMIERTEGDFDFGGIFDLTHFLNVASDLGLYVILRAGPYICAEWDFGGLPAWLLTKPFEVRTHDKDYLAYVKRYFTHLFDILRPRLLENGGNIIMMQVENEYGSYGEDRQYLQAIKDMYAELDMPVTLFTADGPSDWMLDHGTLDGVLATVNFGSRPKESFELLRSIRPNDPLMCMEYWCGWFDHWGEQHHTRSASDAAACLDEILSLGASVNVYMFCGGTNFGFMNGANYGENIEPTVTSYDYDSPLNEHGRRTAKFFAFKTVLEKHFGKKDVLSVEDPAVAAYGDVQLYESCSMYDMLGAAVYSENPITAEQACCNYGYVLYSSEAPCGSLCISGVCDNAYVYINEEYRGMLRRGEKMLLTLKELSIIDILADNLGRVNYHNKTSGENRLIDRKGMTHDITLDGKPVTGWSIFGLGDDMTRRADYEDGIITGVPSFMRGRFDIDKKPRDTFLRLDGFGRGVVFINGFCLGRYRREGPQKTLYVPSVLLNMGENTVEVFETESFKKPTVTFTDKIDLG